MKNIILLIISIFLIIPLVTSIELYDINIITNNTWYFNDVYKIDIQTINIDNNLTDIEYIDVWLTNVLNYTSFPIIRKGSGEYTQSFLVTDSNISFILFNITAQEEEKIISKIFEVKIIQKSFSRDYYDRIINYIENIKDDIPKKLEKYGLNIIIFVFAGLSIFIFIDIFIRRKKK